MSDFFARIFFGLENIIYFFVVLLLAHPLAVFLGVVTMSVLIVFADKYLPELEEDLEEEQS